VLYSDLVRGKRAKRSNLWGGASPRLLLNLGDHDEEQGEGEERVRQEGFDFLESSCKALG